jgi:small subunit ribosomal protein S20
MPKLCSFACNNFGFVLKSFLLFCSQEVSYLPNIKSAEKRVKVSKTKTLKNVIRKSALKTVIKKCKEAVSHAQPTAADTFVDAVKAIDKAASKKLLHKKTAARRKSKLAKALNAMNK